MVDILLNELSLSGQCNSREEFIEKILPSFIEVLDEIQSIPDATIYKKEDFWLSKVTNTDTIYDILTGNLSRQYPSIRKFKRQLLSTLFAKPYWEKTRKHSPKDSYTYGGNNICNHSVAEACERDKIIVSFKDSDLFQAAILHILKNNSKQIIIDNLFNAGHCQNVLNQRGITCQFSLKYNIRFQKTEKIYQGQPIYKETYTGYYWYLDNFHRNHYEVFDSKKQHLGIANMKGQIDPTKKVNGRTLP